MQNLPAINAESTHTGSMTDTEVQWLRAIQRAARLTRRDEGAFGLVILTIYADLLKLRPYPFSDINAAVAAGFKPEIETFVDRLNTGDDDSGSFASSSPENRFLADVDGFIEFAIRNGLTFRRALSILSHDVSALNRYETSMDKARSDCFEPMVTGWADKNKRSLEMVEQSAVE
jgi:hypothetical protein